MTNARRPFLREDVLIIIVFALGQHAKLRCSLAPQPSQDCFW